MHPAWIASMNYHEIPEEERQPFYEWYTNMYPDGLEMISAAYKEWKETH